MTINDWTNDRADPESRGGYPFGVSGVAATLAALGGVIGLLMPMAWIEQLSWQLYLDQLIAAARPPLGMTARLAAVLALAGLLGIIGWAAATLLRVRRNDSLFDSLVARLRGTQSADEADAPSLRAADRHPDAPARRPFSAARDIPVAADVPVGAIDDPMWVDSGRYDAAWDDGADEGDELLLDASYDDALSDVPVDTPVAPVPVVGESDEPLGDTVPLADGPALERAVNTDALPADDQGYAPAHSVWRLPPVAEPVAAPLDADAPLVLSAAPDHDDSDADQTAPLAFDAPAMIEPDVAEVDLPDADLADLDLPVPAAADMPDMAKDAVVDERPLAASRVAPEPLDLSVARLDELIARLEAGLARRTTTPLMMPMDAGQDNNAVIEQGDAAIDMPPALARGGDAAAVNDPMFPQDPALAAALATLRRMNSTAG